MVEYAQRPVSPVDGAAYDPGVQVRVCVGHRTRTDCDRIAMKLNRRLTSALDSALRRNALSRDAQRRTSPLTSGGLSQGSRS